MLRKREGDPARWAAAAVGLMARAEATGDYGAVDEAVELLTRALRAIPAADPRRAGYLASLGRVHRDRHRLTGSLPALADAVAAHRETVAATPPGHPERPVRLFELAGVLVDLAGRGAGEQPLDEAVACLREAVARAPRDHPLRGLFLSNLGSALLQRYEGLDPGRRERGLPPLDEAAAALREALAALPAGAPVRAVPLYELGRALLHRAGNPGAEGAEREAIASLCLAAGQGDTSDPAVDRARAAAATLLDRWLDTLRRAAADTGPRRAEALERCGLALRERYRQTGDGATLDDAVGALEAAVQATGPGEPDLARRLGGLGDLLAERFGRTGEEAALDRAVAVLRDAVEAARPGSADRTAALHDLGVALTRRADHTGDSGALEQAVEALREAARTPPGAGDPVVLASLANALVLRAMTAGAARAPDEADEAVALLRAAAEAAPAGHPDRATVLVNLAHAPRLLAGGRGAAAADEAAAGYRQALQAAPGGHVVHAVALVNLALTLRERFAETGDLRVLEEAVATGRAAVASLPADHAGRPVALLRLGGLLASHHRQTGAAASGQEALGAWRAAAGAEAAPAAVRAAAAAAWGRHAFEAGDVAQAAAGLGAAVAELGRLAWPGLRRADQERLLAQFPLVAGDAAAAAVAAGDPERAVELVEHGRGVLLARALDARTEHDELRLRAPELAERLASVHMALDSPAGTAADERRGALAREREALLREVRARPGFEDFLRPLRFAALRAAAAAGPVVILNVSTFRCDALTLTAAGVGVTPLPGITAAGIAERALEFLPALDLLRAPAGYSEARVRDELAARRAVARTLAWLADAVTGPVLAGLGLSGRPEPGQPLPRVWWCPTSLLAFFPLHAAGRPPGALLDRVVSSYTPTLRALLHARARAAADGSGPPLLVAMPHTPGQADLETAAAEAAAIAGRFPAAEQLQGPAATRAAVLAALGRAPWAHFACHAEQDQREPGRARLLLHDGPLTVRDIAACRLEQAELAFVSACRTSRGGAALADEAITVATALQLAGFRHVVGGLWAVRGDAAREIAAGLYGRLPAPGGRLDASGTAVALHGAVRALRDRLPHAPAAWAPFVHAGP